MSSFNSSFTGECRPLKAKKSKTPHPNAAKTKHTGSKLHTRQLHEYGENSQSGTDFSRIPQADTNEDAKKKGTIRIAGNILNPIGPGGGGGQRPG